MKGKGVKDIVSRELELGETSLWAHVISDDKTSLLNPKLVESLNRAFYVLCLVMLAYSLYSFLSLPADKFFDQLKIISLMVLIPLGLKFFSNTKLGRRLEAETDRQIFQNILVTDKRVLFFNHDSDNRQDLPFSHIEKVNLDYENGGHALAVKSKNSGKPFIAIGQMDFAEALQIIKNEISSRGLNP